METQLQLVCLSAMKENMEILIKQQQRDIREVRDTLREIRKTRDIISIPKWV